jgi:hypothetical protein
MTSESSAVSAQIIPFRAPSSGGWKARARVKRAVRQGRAREAEQDPNMKETVRNHRFRQARRDAWRDADRLTDFARARMDWDAALKTAQSWSVPGAEKYPDVADEGLGARFPLVDDWRNALVLQMLTPAPDQGAVNWKKAQLRAGQHRYVGVKDAKLQRAIDGDVEWLNAHPTRKSIAATRQAKKDDRS